MSLDWYLTLDVDTGGTTLHNVSLGSWNLTYNLTNMLNVAYELDTDNRALFSQVFDKQITSYYDLWDEKTGGELIEGLEQAIGRMEANPDKYKAFNPPNGWGTYEGALETLKDFLETCKNHPKGVVSMWR